MDLEEVIHNQYKGSTGVKHFSICKSSKGLHPFPQLLDTLPTGMTHPVEWVWLGQPNVAGPWHTTKSIEVVSDDSPASQTSDPTSAGRHHGPGNGGMGGTV